MAEMCRVAEEGPRDLTLRLAKQREPIAVIDNLIRKAAAHWELTFRFPR